MKTDGPEACADDRRRKRDNPFIADTLARLKSREDYLAWLKEWVLDLPDHAAYRAKLGAKLDELRITGKALSAPANYAAE